eukprot:Tamp_21965.p1 GENE.Tamp_21965~~Tamp_21965.p1  ORF type:complete len:362 (+),score=34.54 Tamp_21965:1-1086(+)
MNGGRRERKLSPDQGPQPVSLRTVSQDGARRRRESPQGPHVCARRSSPRPDGGQRRRESPQGPHVRAWRISPDGVRANYDYRELERARERDFSDAPRQSRKSPGDRPRQSLERHSSQVGDAHAPRRLPGRPGSEEDVPRQSLERHVSKEGDVPRRLHRRQNSDDHHVRQNGDTDAPRRSLERHHSGGARRRSPEQQTRDEALRPDARRFSEARRHSSDDKDRDRDRDRERERVRQSPDRPRRVADVSDVDDRRLHYKASSPEQRRDSPDGARDARRSTNGTERTREPVPAASSRARERQSPSVSRTQAQEGARARAHRSPPPRGGGGEAKEGGSENLTFHAFRQMTLAGISPEDHTSKDRG